MDLMKRVMQSGNGVIRKEVSSIQLHLRVQREPKVKADLVQVEISVLFPLIHQTKNNL
jgi:hypothetical protein